MDGKLPASGQEVDHIDGNRSNNSFENLRLCTRLENCQNRKVPTDNSSGFLGVSKNWNRWRATIQSMNEWIHIGTYDTKEEAHAAYLKKKKELHTFNPVPREAS